jgi:hypothetical protein
MVVIKKKQQTVKSRFLAFLAVVAVCVLSSLFLSANVGTPPAYLDAVFEETGTHTLYAAERIKNTTSPPMKFFLVHSTDETSFGPENVRVVESIFFHHPNAQVSIYYTDTSFNGRGVQPIINAGYNLILKQFNLENLLLDALAIPGSLIEPGPVRKFIKNLPEYIKTKYWYTNQSNVLRALLLYTQGGIYMDTDILLVKPLDELHNVIGMEFIDKVNGAVLKFDQYNPFVAAVLNNVFENFDPNIWGNNGPAAVTRTLFGTPKYADCAHGNSTLPCDVNVLPKTAFYPLYWREIEYTCFLDTSSNHTKLKASIQASSYMVHTNNKASRKYWDKHQHTQPNTLCRWLYNSFCVLCGTTL